MAGVPAGTHARLMAMEERQKAEMLACKNSIAKRNELGYAHYYERHADADADVGRLDGFLTYGWGKFSALDGVPATADYGIDADPVLCDGLHCPRTLASPARGHLRFNNTS